MTTIFVRVTAAIALATLSAFAPSVFAFPLTWTLSEFQPNIPNGGRANTIAVHPTNNDVMIVASETGGLFRTTDRGITWRHIDTFLPHGSAAAVFLSANPNIVIATAGDGFTDANGGGILRSTDGGLNWTHVADPAAPPGVTERFTASEISVAPDTGKIFVATSFGVSMSADLGVTWTQSLPFSGSGASSVLALPGDLILAGAPWLAVARSTNGGGLWAPSATGPWVSDMHAFGRSPFDATHAYAVNRDTQLFVTEDGGVSWTRIMSAPAGGGSCGGIGLVKAIRPMMGRFSSLTLYFGNRCGLARMSPPRIAGTTRFDYSGAWTSLGMDHGDTRDLAFSRTGPLVRPLLLATDGGLHRTVDGGLNWTFTGGGVNGYNALQITEVKSQWIDDIGRYDLYFGTQDNNNLASTDTGATWPTAICCEGFFFEMLKHVPTTADSQVTYVSCGACVNLRSGAALAGTVGWTNPPGTLAGNPAIIAKSFHVQNVNADSGLPAGLAVTQNLGTTWASYAAYAEDHHDMPKLSRRTFLRRLQLPVQYQSIRAGFDPTLGIEIDHLVRISKRFSSATAFVGYPAMNGFGGLGINPTMFAWYQVFGVDPTDSRYIIAPDIINEKMMQTADGGENWTENAALTTLVTDGGRFRFRSWVFPHASAVSYYSDSSMVAVGTHQNGVMLSSDHGATWAKIPDSQRATYITSIEWRSATDLIVSTYGRGLWRIRGTFWIPRFEPLCVIVNCLLRYIDRGDPPPDRFDRGIVIFEGRAQGARMEGARLAEVFVSPGSSVGFVADRTSEPKVKITESRRFVGLRGNLRGFRWPGEGVQVIALALDKGGGLIGTAVARSNLPVSEPVAPQEAPIEESEQPSQKSPTEGKPYINLIAPKGHIEKLGPGDRLTIVGRNFAQPRAMEIVVDGVAVKKMTAGDNGSFSVTIAAPPAFGLHTLTVRETGTQRVIDGALFNVSHGDEPKDGARDKGAGRPVRITPPKPGK